MIILNKGGSKKLISTELKLLRFNLSPFTKDYRG